MAELLELFVMFFRIGAFTFGGGYAMIPVIQREVVEKKGWFDDEEIIDCFAISQFTPGAITVNTATFVGYKKKGIIGGIIATIGAILPSLILITIITTFFMNFQDNEVVQHAFGGIRIGVAALITNTALKMFRHIVTDRISLIIFAVAFVFIAFTNFSPIIIITVSAVLGILREKIEPNLRQ
jgi:chromate transporter